MSLNSPYIGYTNKETIDNLVVFEEQNGRNNIPFSEIKTTGRNMLKNLIIKKISRKYLAYRNSLSYIDDKIDARYLTTNSEHSFTSKYPDSLFSKGVKILNEEIVGFIMKETKDKIVVFGNYVQRYDIPKSKTYEVGSNIFLNMNMKEFVTYEVDNYNPLPE
ncbi:hypothetical protein [Candidatus Nitrosocosmicus sp. R]